jgi:hypothetical protein
MRGEGVREGNVLIYLSVALSSSPHILVQDPVYEGDFAGGSVCTQYLLLPWEGGILFGFFHSFPPFRKDFRPVPARIFMGRPRLELEFL